MKDCPVSVDEFLAALAGEPACWHECELEGTRKRDDPRGCSAVLSSADSSAECCRRRGHPGPHVACTRTTHAFAVWYDNPKRPD